MPEFKVILELPTPGRCPKIDVGRARTVLGRGNPGQNNGVPVVRRTAYSLAFAVGEPVAYVQAPKAKGRGDRVLTGFSNSPTTGLRGCLRGRTADIFSPKSCRGAKLEPSSC